MTEADVLGYWNLGFVLGAVVVLVVAVVLITILVVARKIAGLAESALAVAGDIQSTTESIWSIGPANVTVEKIAAKVKSVDERVHGIADKLDPGGAI